MADKLRVGVVGVGYLGRFHALIYSRMENVELAGVNDVDREQARRVAAEAGCGLLSIEEMLEQLDAVSIVVPTTLHLKIAAPFLRKGIHMLLEKPISSTIAEGRQIIELARASGATLQIGHLERYNAGIMALAAQIEQPRFIEAQRMGGFKARATDVDVISDLMIHDIDIIMSLIDSEITSISASGTAVLTDHLDIANARLEFANGAAANITASRISREDSRRIRVFEPRHYLSLDFIAQRMERAAAVPSQESQWGEITTETVDIEPVMPLDEELDSFVAAVINHQPPLVDGETGLKALDVALQIKQKIEG